MMKPKRFAPSRAATKARRVRGSTGQRKQRQISRRRGFTV